MQKIIDLLKIVGQKLYNVSGIATISYWNIISIFILTVCVIGLEYFMIKDKKQTSFKHLLTFDKSIQNDILSWFIDLFGLFTFGGVLLTFGSFYFVTVSIYKHPEYHLHFNQLIKNPLLQFIVLFVLRDLKEYWQHRFFHTYKPFWNLHAFHHSSNKLAIISGHRGHMVEGMIAGVLDALLFMILGSPLLNLVYLVYIKEIHFLVTHSNFTSSWGFVGKYILVSPATHRLHHSNKEEHFNRNFSGMFIFGDKIFGTYYDHKNEILNFGVPKSHYNKHGYFYDMIYSYWLFLKDCFFQFKKIF